MISKRRLIFHGMFDGALWVALALVFLGSEYSRYAENYLATVAGVFFSSLRWPLFLFAIPLFNRCAPNRYRRGISITSLFRRAPRRSRWGPQGSIGRLYFMARRRFLGWGFG